jgi:hypothetical protein
VVLISLDGKFISLTIRCGDVAVCIYSYANQFTEYYDMNVYTFFVSYLMVGVRGFYSNVFPCYNMSNLKLQPHCDPSQIGNQTLISSPTMFLLIVLMRLI